MATASTMCCPTTETYLCRGWPAASTTVHCELSGADCLEGIGAMDSCVFEEGLSGSVESHLTPRLRKQNQARSLQAFAAGQHQSRAATRKLYQ